MPAKKATFLCLNVEKGNQRVALFFRKLDMTMDQVVKQEPHQLVYILVEMLLG